MEKAVIDEVEVLETHFLDPFDVREDDDDSEDDNEERAWRAPTRGR